MLHGIFTIFDAKARSYSQPFYAPTTEVAVRMFRQPVNDPGHPMNRYSEDYTLFHVGEFDDEDGMVMPTETPVRVIGAWECFDQVNVPVHEDSERLLQLKKAFSGEAPPVPHSDHD